MRWLIDLPGPAATDDLAAALAPLALAGDVIALQGDLGTGKTAFARAFINARLGPVEVPSPTFNLVLTYDPASSDAPPIWHFDVYRLEDEEEAYELGWEEALTAAVTLVEWPERISGLLPPERLLLAFTMAPARGGRRVMIDAPAAWGPRLAPLAATRNWPTC